VQYSAVNNSNNSNNNNSISISIVIIITRSPSNIRPTTRECVHLVMDGHFQSRDKGSGHTFDPSYSKTPCVRKLHGCVSYRTGVIAE